MDSYPYATRIVIPIRNMDDQFMQIQDLIDVKRKMLIEKQKKLREISKQNRFLEVVRNDYSKFNDYITQQKRDQIRALQILDNYIKDLCNSGKLTKYNLEDAKEEQKKIVRELNSIKANIDNIIGDTKDVQEILNKKV